MTATNDLAIGADMKILGQTRRQPTLRLPSIRAALTIDDCESAGGQKFAVISDGTFHTMILQYALDPRVDHATLAAQWVRFWGDQIGIDAANNDLVSVSAVLDFEAITRDDFELWCEDFTRNSVPPLEIPTAPLGLVSLTFRMRNGRDAATGASVVLGVRLPALMRSFHTAGLPLTPLTSADVIGHLAHIYGPRSNRPSVEWSEIVPDHTEETRHHLMHPDRSKTVSWLFFSRRDEIVEQILTRAVATTALPSRRIAMSFRRTRDERGTVLRRQVVAMSAVVPAGQEPNTEGLLGTNTSQELPVAARVAMRRAYDRQGEIAALTSGVGVVLPEHGEIGEHPVLHDDLAAVMEAFS